MTSSIATILFTDVVDSTALMQRLGDELDRARTQFEDIGMSGWLRHAAQLTTTLETRT
jgi:hypothetical protein